MRGDVTTFRLPGYRIAVENSADEGIHAAQIAIVSRRGVPAIAAEPEFLATPGTLQPLEVVLPVGENRPAWSRKFACPVRGKVWVGDHAFVLDPTTHLAIADFHEAFYLYRMRWTWATCAGFADDGRIVGLNLTHNLVADDELHNE